MSLHANTLSWFRSKNSYIFCVALTVSLFNALMKKNKYKFHSHCIGLEHTIYHIRYTHIIHWHHRCCSTNKTKVYKLHRKYGKNITYQEEGASKSSRKPYCIKSKTGMSFIKIYFNFQKHAQALKGKNKIQIKKSTSCDNLLIK
jgi:hypothetical protein